MNGAQKAIFPGMLVGVLFLIGLTNLIGLPAAVLASTEEAGPVFTAAAVVESYSSALPLVASSADQPAESQPAPAQEPASQPNEPEQRDSGCSISDAFPQSVLQWCDLIERYSSEAGLDPELVAALIVQESGGNPDAYSHSGAVGLMQVMPNDGIAASFMCVNGPCFASRPSSAELYDPEFNIRFGTRMLAGLVSKRGSVRDALLAYGPANVGYYYADKVLAIYDSKRQ